MAQNSGNGVIYTGDSKGIVNMWSPNMREPLAYVKCHNSPLAALCGDNTGREFISCGLDRKVQIWDVRNIGECINKFKLRSVPYQVDVSQKGLIAVGLDGVCEIFKSNSMSGGKLATPYLRYSTPGCASGMEFCPFEDVMGIATQTNFSSILVPGAGEPNFDAYEANPFQSKAQRRETEVKNLLDKIPMDLIALDPEAVLKVNVPTAKERIQMKKKIIFAKPPKIDFKPRMKKKSKNSSSAKRKQIVHEDIVREFKKTVEPFKKLLLETEAAKKTSRPITNARKPVNLLDRFKKKSQLNI